MSNQMSMLEDIITNLCKTFQESPQKVIALNDLKKIENALEKESRKGDSRNNRSRK